MGRSDVNAQTKVEAPSIEAVLATVLPKLGAVYKNKKNPAFKSNYADLSAVLAAIAPIAEHGLWFRQVPVQIDGGIGIETFYVHVSGAELSAGVTPVPVNKNDAQGLGSAMTYGRRYGLMTAFGLSADDDDGNAAARAAPRVENAPAKLSDDDLTKIIQLCEAVGGNQPALICNAYKIEALTDLTPSQAQAVIRKLSDKLASKAKAQTDEKAVADA